jgi:hypothetical protein
MMQAMGGVLQFLGTVGQFVGRLEAAEARRGEFEQRIRSLEVKKQQTLSLTLGRAAASGIGYSMSTDQYLATLAGEFDREIMATRQAKDRTYRADQWGAIGGYLGGMGNAMGGGFGG